jgi:hypothetical protein
MACKNLTKAVLCEPRTYPPKRSHALVRKHLHQILAETYRRYHERHQQLPGAIHRQFLKLISEISLLTPAKESANRPDNCEYLWLDPDGNVRSPLDHDFSSADPMNLPNSRLFFKLLRFAVREMQVV